MLSDSKSLNVLIVGGGCAALEAAFTLQRVAGDRVDTTILAPDDYFVTQALAVLVPFAAGHVPHEPLDQLAADAGARLRRGRMVSVDTENHEVLTEEAETIPYDALLIAIGAVKHAPYPHALTFGGSGSEERMHGLVQDLEAGYVRRIAFVVPTGASWPVPLYELALMAAGRAYDMYQDCEVVLVTDEETPLAMFGPAISGMLATHLADVGIEVHTDAHVDVPGPHLVVLHPGGERLTVNRVVSLPTLAGPAVKGLPHDAGGYLPVDLHCRVDGASDVYAAGDVTHFPIKQGGLACQQADAAAEMIAAQAGVPVEPQAYAAVLQGVLVTEGRAAFLRRDVDRAADDDRTGSGQALWWPPTKIAGRELSRRVAGLPRHLLPPEIEGVAISQSVDGESAQAFRQRADGNRPRS